MATARATATFGSEPASESKLGYSASRVWPAAERENERSCKHMNTKGGKEYTFERARARLGAGLAATTTTTTTTSWHGQLGRESQILQQLINQAPLARAHTLRDWRVEEKEAVNLEQLGAGRRRCSGGRGSGSPNCNDMALLCRARRR